VGRSGSATVTYSSMNASVAVDGSLVSGVGGTYNIVSTPADTTVTVNAGTGNHTFIVSPTARNLDSVAGNLNLTNVSGKGTNTLVVNDQNNPNPDTFTVTSSGVSRTHSAKIQFFGTATVHAGPGNNTVSVLSTPTFGSLTIDGGGGTDYLVAPNAVNTFDITGLNAGSLGLLKFSSVESLNGNAMADTFKFEDAGALSGSINGEGSTDTLDFSKKTTPVTLDLTNRKLTVTVSATSPTYKVDVYGIENANGGSANDVLMGDSYPNDLEGNGGNDIIVGNAGNDTLIGGGGRDVIIGGLGMDTLDGRGDSDLLIGGTTSYDANTVALTAILAEWTSANPYATRINNLRTGGGLSGGNILQSTGGGRTVFDDGDADTFTGGQDLDWFFEAAGDVITDLHNGGPETTS
jgi:serralysin